MRPTAATLLIAACLASPLAAADLVEPWPDGLSSLELAVAGDAGGGRGAGSLVGAGLGKGFSLGLSVGSEEGGATTYGALLLYSRSVGPVGELDVWCETIVAEAGDSTGCGAEWSRRHAHFVPYARLTVDLDAGSSSLTPLAGLLVPLSPSVGLHVEVSLEAADGERRLRVAAGPNWSVASRLELVPEIAWQEGSDGVDLALGLAVDVSR